MAIYNEILVPRIARGIQKLFGIKGAVPAKQLAGEIMPVHLIPTGAETRFLDGWNRWGVGILSTANAANTNGVQLRNPSGSNMIAVIERAIVFSSAGQELDYGIIAGAASIDLAGVHGSTSLDQRVVGPPASATLVESDSNTSPLSGNIFFRTFANIDLIPTVGAEIVIAPGSLVRVVSTLANTQILVNFCWRERLLEEAERQ
jgi:hypothetical protein